MKKEPLTGRAKPGLIQDMPLFKDLSPRQLEDVAKMLTCAVVPAGAVLMERDDPGEEIVLVVSGAVKVCAAMPDGGQSIVHIGGPGEIFGEMAVVDGRMRSATVVALEECGICRIGREDFWTTLWDLPPVPYNLVCLLNQRLRHITEQAQSLKHLTPPQRTANQLAALFEDLGHAIPGEPRATLLPFHLTPPDLASLAGVQADVAEVLLLGWFERGVLRRNENGHLIAMDLNLLQT
jgi:CRP-like cAMP-binding protein